MQCRAAMWKIRYKILIFLLWMMEIRLASSFISSIICARIPGLTHPQRQICIESPDTLIALGEGHRLSAQECEYQFRGHRWNCTKVWQEEVFAHVMFVGSREAAFTYAIASAGAAHAITSACARGNISLCGCDMRHKPNLISKQTSSIVSGFEVNNVENSKNNLNDKSYDSPPWKWGGCSADIDFGIKYARKFMDAREIEADERSLMNLHNNRVGRRMVKNLLRTDCKCHGVSGSCVLKTCWKTLPAFRVVGDALMRKYNKAKTVQAVSGKRGLKLVLSKSIQGKHMQVPKRLDLVYLQSSPNYCERNAFTGTPGTVGRRCNTTLKGPQSCDLLCCGRGYNTHRIRRITQCRCQFQWCCQVQCDTCEELEEQFYCK